ncbi:MAG: hypothetical protein FWG85_00145 [Bacteroidetes bacterium]|nr:hypothetical protein [Bacteroidota bacterium]
MYKEQEHLTLNNKRTQGQYFTKYNPFENEGFLEWAEKYNLKEQTILEPFAGANNLIDMLNDRLARFREDTNDIFLTPFKGLRKDNKYRRRLDYALARKLISEVA